MVWALMSRFRGIMLKTTGSYRCSLTTTVAPLQIGNLQHEMACAILGCATAGKLAPFAIGKYM